MIQYYPKLKTRKNYIINKYYSHVLSDLINPLELITEPSVKQIKNIMVQKIQRRVFSNIFSKRASNVHIKLNKTTKDTIKFIESNIIN